MDPKLDRLSYLRAADIDLSTTDLTFNPCKNLNDIFQEVEDENLKVYLRVRPSLPGECAQGEEDTHVEILDSHSILLTAPASSNTFKNSNHGITNLSQKFMFSHIYGPSTTQRELFDTSTLGLVNDFISGQNCLLFTYGATNSGKTFTIQGTATDVGILPRALDVLFGTIGDSQYPLHNIKPKFFCGVVHLEEKDVLKEEEKKENIFKLGASLTSTLSQSVMSLSKLSCNEDSVRLSQAGSEVSAASSSMMTEKNRVSELESRCHDNTCLDITGDNKMLYAIFVSFAEIYNEYIFDLLDKMPTSRSNKRNPLVLGEDRNGSIYIKGLQEVRVNSGQEAMRVLDIGRQNLHFAATRLNHNSSRSHSIFTIKLVRLASADNPHVARVSMLSVCDLAGAERAGKSKSNQDRLKEAGNINSSLLVLSRCIEALRHNQIQKGSKKREVPVPYRDSKLTRLFQSYFLGRGKAAMIVNISRLPLLFDETLQVLKFSAIAKQVTLNQAKEPDVKVQVQPPKRMSQFSRFVRQSMRSSGRLSVPWMKNSNDVTFGASDSTIEEKPMTTLEEEDEQEDEKFDALVQLIASLKEKLVKEHKEKVELESRLREELCNEFSQQVVEIENQWSQRLKNQQARLEEDTEWKIQALMKSAKKIGGRKRFKPEDDPDEEYISSLLYFQEQHKVEELSKEVEELEIDRKNLKDEVEALKDTQKKIRELGSKAQEEKSHLTFQLAQLTQNFNKLEKELEEAKQVHKLSKGTESLVIEELQSRLEEKRSQLEKQDSEIKELRTYLCEAAEMCIAKEEECAKLEKSVKLGEQSLTQQMLAMNEKESQLEEARSMLSQRAAQVEERDQYIEELREQLTAQQKHPDTAEKHREQQKMLEKAERRIRDMEEEHLREKSKLLLEIAELRRTGQQHQQQTTPEELKASQLKTTQLQLENDQLMQDNGHLGNQLSETKSLFDHLRRTNATLENDYSAVAKERDNLKETIQVLSDKLISLQEERASELLEISVLRSEKESAMNQVNTMKDELLAKETHETSLETPVETIKGHMGNAADYQEALKKQQELVIESQELKDKVKGHDELQQKFSLLEAQLKKIDEERKDTKTERDNLLMKLIDVEHTKQETEHDLIQSKKTIESLEKKLSQQVHECKETEITLKEEMQAKLLELEETAQESSSLCEKLEKEKEELETHLIQEIHSKSDALRNLASVNEELKKELAEQQQALKEKAEAERRLQERLKELDHLKSNFQCLASLQEENSALKLKLKEHRDETETVKSVSNEISSKCCNLEDQVQCKDKEIHTLQMEYAELKERLEVLQKTSAKVLTQKLDSHTHVLESRLLEKDLEIRTLKDREVHLQMELESVGEQMSDLQKRVADKSTISQLKNDLAKMKCEESRLCQDKTELQDELDAVKELSHSQKNVLTEKEDIIAALHGKIDSLDRKLLKAEEEVEEKTRTANTFAAIRAKNEDLQQKCDVLEKEIRAVREARQEELLQHSVQLKEQEDRINQKETEVSSLQIEVKKLLQQSVVSCNMSHTSEMDSSHKREREEHMDLKYQNLRDEFRRKEALNNTLMQEILDLKSQMEKMSVSLSCQSITNVLSKNDTVDSYATGREKQQTSASKGRRGRKLCPLAYTPSDASQLGLDSSVEETGGKRGEPFQVPTSSTVTPPQRSSRRIRYTTRTPSFEYDEPLKPTGRKKSENDDEWQPSSLSKRMPKTTRKSTRKSKPNAPSNPYLKDQENKSSVANKAHEGEQLQLTEENKPSSKKPVQRKTRQLYKADLAEPYECSPCKLDVQEADSPHSVVRRQLRSKRK